MPKVNHRRGGGGTKNVQSAEEIDTRNEQQAAKGKGGGKGYPEKEAKKETLGSSSSEGEEEPEAKPEKKKEAKPKTGVGGIEVVNRNLQPRNEEKEGIEISRKQREEMEKQAARRRYEELHKAGKTDEAKADLARLEEVKKRRAEQAAKRLETEAAAKAAEEAKLEKKGGMSKEVKEALGGEAARTGSRVKNIAKSERVKNEVDLYSYVDGAGAKIEKSAEPEVKKEAGTIDACRDAEDDFM